MKKMVNKILIIKLHSVKASYYIGQVHFNEKRYSEASPYLLKAYELSLAQHHPFTSEIGNMIRRNKKSEWEERERRLKVEKNNFYAYIKYLIDEKYEQELQGVATDLKEKMKIRYVIYFIFELILG